MNLQENFLEEIKISKKEVEVILIKGVHIKGIIEGYDNFSILVNSNGKQQTLYKHSISTIIR
ncbi:RNA chaperone Hfq [Metabacillus arenae]|uniref:RNA-binding protein Hfq n=1 Tax=Metabacillus arenae TaxID=2771434 RepID=A0A926RZK4_9BACI|nr:RNA chaperone Hfq [Metabacillus arenae]MBD1382352.1 RNA chaperone Hfq [Metabacillus arenae]